MPREWRWRNLRSGCTASLVAVLLGLPTVSFAQYWGCRRLTCASLVDYFASTLLEMPLEPMILAEAVYQHSTTMDGRHFAEEFVRRKKLADRGQFDKEPVATAAESKNAGNGGWNEVAKKGGSVAPKEETSTTGFRVVPAKKKGKKN